VLGKPPYLLGLTPLYLLAFFNDPEYILDMLDFGRTAFFLAAARYFCLAVLRGLAGGPKLILFLCGICLFSSITVHGNGSITVHGNGSIAVYGGYFSFS
jgi:hypothetical protein